MASASAYTVALTAAHHAERLGEGVRDIPHVLVVVTEPVPPLLAEAAGEIAKDEGIAVRQQVIARIAREAALARAAALPRSIGRMSRSASRRPTMVGAA